MPMERATLAGCLLLVVALHCAFQSSEAAGTILGFYKNSCPNAEATIKAAVQAKFNSDKTIVPGLLRMFFHDCFVTGCDASLLIKSKNGNTAERDAGPNQTLHGFDLIDTAKAAVEKICPNTVSCADIISLATRDAVVLAGGTSFDVLTGRRDGLVSKSSNVNLPGPATPVPQAIGLFNSKGLSAADMVTLLGAHTVGVAHCSSFNDRLWNFKNTGKADPSMDPTLVTALKKTCPQNLSGLGSAVNLDQGTPSIVDKSYFKELLVKKGILQIDQSLASNGVTSKQVTAFASAASTFNQDFGAAMRKLGNVGVLTGTNGQIRKICSSIN